MAGIFSVFIAQFLRPGVGRQIAIDDLRNDSIYNLFDQVGWGGVTATRPALDQDERAWDCVVDTNLKGVWLVAQAAAHDRQQGAGIIVNIASILGVRVAGAVAAYAISKAGVIQMTKALALEWAR